MQITSVQQEDMLFYGKETSCIVHSILVELSDVGTIASELISLISETSWINNLNAIDKAAFESRSKRTITKLVSDIFSDVQDEVTSDFGEYMISYTAQNALCTELSHKKIPLAELWKEKVTGNPGFDFHTESVCNIIAFGEAKYSGSDNPYTPALTQILDFIKLEKDTAEIGDLSKFASPISVSNYLQTNKKAFIAAFSINGKHPKKIMNNALNSDFLDELLIYDELYLIGISIV